MHEQKPLKNPDSYSWWFVLFFRCNWNLSPQQLSLTWPRQCWSLALMSSKTINVNLPWSIIAANRDARLSETAATITPLSATWHLAAETTGSLWRRSNWRLLCHPAQKEAIVNHTPLLAHPATRFQMHYHQSIMFRCLLISCAVLGLLIVSPPPLRLTPRVEGREVSAGPLTTFCPALWTTWSVQVQHYSPGRASCSAVDLWTYSVGEKATQGCVPHSWSQRTTCACLESILCQARPYCCRLTSRVTWRPSRLSSMLHIPSNLLGKPPEIALKVPPSRLREKVLACLSLCLFPQHLAKQLLWK